MLNQSIYPLGRGKTSFFPKCFAANSLWLDEVVNLVLENMTEHHGKQEAVYW